MSIQPDDRLTDVWREVRDWPAQLRVSLATRILQSLEGGQTGPSRKTPADLIGVWRTHHPPGDQGVERILEEERMRKHG